MDKKTIPSPDPAECTNAGGTCATRCATEEGQTQINDNGACSKTNTSKIVCCKNATVNSNDIVIPPPPGTPQKFKYNNFLGVESFTALIINALSAIQGIVGWLAVIMIVVGGLMYIVSSGTKMTEMAKATVTWALIGFAIAVAAPSIINELYQLVSAGGSSTGSVFQNANPIAKIITNVLTFLLMAVGILAIIGFVISGILFVTSAGNSSQADSARKAMVYTIIGVVVSGAGLIILTQVLQLLGGRA